MMTALHTVLSTNTPTTLAIIGLAKNTGKTTTLNACIKTLHTSKTLALTSIGLDGEKIDQVTFLPKPHIAVKKGMILATAEQTLTTTTCQYRLIKRTLFSTALGDIIIIKITHPGEIVIAGPTTNTDLHHIITELKTLSDMVLIDGAFNRKTFASIPTLDGVILATGASLHPEMETTVKTTKTIVESFQLPKTTYDITPIQNNLKPLPKYTLNTKKPIGTILPLQNPYQNKTLYIKGAITKSIIDTFIRNTEKNMTLLIQDATKLLLPTHYFSYIKKLNLTIEVLHKIPLLCVTINPFRPNGMDYDKTTFKIAMQAAITIPVINVQEKE
ncbi:MAG: hypothetical protein ACOCU2_00290 [Bacillota bacterium]